MRSRKRVDHVVYLSDSELEQKRAKQLVAIHANLAPLLVKLEGLNAAADQVPANWLARGRVEELEVGSQKMVLRLRPEKPIPEGLYQYWTTNPVLQIQLVAAYLCDCAVDIFSITSVEPFSRTPKDGGEILTIQVDQAKGKRS